MKVENLLVHSLPDRKVIPLHAQSLGRGDRMSPGAQAKGRMPGGNDPQDQEEPEATRASSCTALHDALSAAQTTHGPSQARCPAAGHPCSTLFSACHSLNSRSVVAFTDGCPAFH